MRTARFAILACALCLAACKPKDPRDPKTWIARLEGGDARARSKAVQELRKLKARTAAPALQKALADATLSDEAAVALSELGNANSVQPHLDTIDTNVGAV